MEKLAKQNNLETAKGDHGEKSETPGIAFVTLGYDLRSGKMVWVNPHAETEEGRAFLLLCQQKVLRKRDFQRYRALSQKARRVVKI